MSLSNFNSPDAFSAYWDYNDGNYTNICATQGRSFLNRVAQVLGLPSGGAWNAALQSALIAAIGVKKNAILTKTPSSQVSAQRAAWDSVMSDLSADLSAQRVGDTSLQAAIYLAYYAPYNGRFDAISIPIGASLPIWGVAPPDDRNANGGRIVCYDPSVDSEPGILSASDLASATVNSSTGVRLGQGRGLGAPTIIQSENNGVVSPLTVFAFAFLILGVALVVRRQSR